MAEPLATLRRTRGGGLGLGFIGFLPVKMGGSHGVSPLFGLYAGPAASVDRSSAHSTARGTLRVGDKVVVVRYKARSVVTALVRYVSVFLGME